MINPRWINIPVDIIYQNLVLLGIKSWGSKEIEIGDKTQYFLFGEDYAYPYSLPIDTINKLANRLNEGILMIWYKQYNWQSTTYFDVHGEVLNQAQMYWEEVGNNTLPRPEILPVDGLSLGDEYIAIVGLFHLTGEQNANNSHLFIDILDENGNRIYDHNPPLWLKWGWDGMTPDEVRATRPVRIDKPAGEPGANIGVAWQQVIYGFLIDNIACDRFRGIHTRYENDGPGNDRGHHSHYIVLQKRKYQEDNASIPETPTPKPPIPVIIKVAANLEWLKTLPEDDQGNVVIFEVGENNNE